MDKATADIVLSNAFRIAQTDKTQQELQAEYQAYQSAFVGVREGLAALLEALRDKPGSQFQFKEHHPGEISSNVPDGRSGKLTYPLFDISSPYLYETFCNPGTVTLYGLVLEKFVFRPETNVQAMITEIFEIVVGRAMRYGIVAKASKPQPGSSLSPAG